MSSLNRIVAAHPLVKYKPYNAIKFAGVDANGTLLYTVAGEETKLSAPSALKAAFEKFGAKCFHCGDWMEPQPMSHHCTRDHVRPKSGGGGNHLHNLVFACGKCNRAKGGNDLVSFSIELGDQYLKALDEHLVRCLKKLGEIERK